MTSAHTADPYHLVVGERIGLEVYHRLVTEVVRSLPSSPQAILDVGAGTGRATFELAGVCPHARVVALDSHRQALARVEARALELGLTRVVPVEGDMDVALPDIRVWMWCGRRRLCTTVKTPLGFFGGCGMFLRRGSRGHCGA